MSINPTPLFKPDNTDKPAGGFIELRREVSSLRYQLFELKKEVDKLRGITQPITPKYKPKYKRFCDLDELNNAFCKEFGLASDELIGKERHQDLVRVRSLFVFAAVTMGYSLNRVGIFLGGRDFSTARHAYERASYWFENDPELNTRYQKVITSLLRNVEE
jgi:chromosomal replication initiation ATPase DnaA